MPRAVRFPWSNTAVSDDSPNPDGPAPAVPPAGGPTPPGQPPGYGVPPSGPATAGPVPYGQAPYGQSQYGQGPYGQPPYHHNPYGQSALGMPGYGAPLRDPDARPGTVLAAGIVTLVSSGLVLLLLGIVLFFLVAARSDFMDGFSDEAGFSASEADGWFTGILVGLLVLIGWCLVAMLLAVLALRRSNVARILLVVSSSVTALVSLLAITSGISALTLVAAVAVIVCLFTGGAGDWYHHEHPYSQPRLPRL